MAKRYYGPFQVLEAIGKVAYRLQLPPDAKIHPIFHVSMLKPFKGDPNDPVANPLPISFHDDHPLVQPAAILASRPSSVSGWDVLVQWHGLSPDETSWEDWSTLCRDYHLEDKVLSQGPRGDTGGNIAEGDNQQNEVQQAMQINNQQDKVQQAISENKEQRPKRRVE